MGQTPLLYERMSEYLSIEIIRASSIDYRSEYGRFLVTAGCVTNDNFKPQFAVKEWKVINPGIRS
jgi:hypothetical protein